MIEFKCGQCGAAMEAPQSLAGQTEKCPTCGGLQTIPSLQEQTPPAPTAIADGPPKVDRPPVATMPPADPSRHASGLMKTEDHPLAHRLAGEYLAANPAATHFCFGCNREVPFVRQPTPTATCPDCGYIPSPGACRTWLNVLASGAEEGSKTQGGGQEGPIPGVRAITIQGRVALYETEDGKRFWSVEEAIANQPRMRAEKRAAERRAAAKDGPKSQGECSRCGKAPRSLRETEDKHWVCLKCYRELYPALASECMIHNLRRVGFTVPDDLSEKEGKRLWLLYLARITGHDLPDDTPLFDLLRMDAQTPLIMLAQPFFAAQHEHEVNERIEQRSEYLPPVRHLYTKVAGFIFKNEDGSDRQPIPLPSCAGGAHTEATTEQFQDHLAPKIEHLCETGEWDGDLVLSCLAGTEIIRVVRGNIYCGGAKTISLPALAEAGDISCPEARRISLPALEKAGNIDCGSAKTISFPALGRVGNIDCWDARKINLPVLAEAGDMHFGNASTVNLPLLVQAGRISFWQATRINLPLLAEAGGVWIQGATTINLPALAKAGVMDFVNASTINLSALAKAKNIYCESANSVEFPSLARAGRIECQRATNINLPALAKAGHMYCPSATGINLPALAKAGKMFCPRATAINLPVLAEAGDMYFGSATKIDLPLLAKASHLHFPRAMTINLPLLVEGGDMFCASAKVINLSMLKKASYIDCPSATGINLPALARADETASRVDLIANLRGQGLEVGDDLPISECIRLSVYLDERKRWPSLPKDTPLELLVRLRAAQWDQVATGSGASLADLRGLILALTKPPSPLHPPNAPLSERIRHFFTKVVGVSFKNDDGSDRQALIRQCKVLDPLELKHEPNNPFDPNAVAVCRNSLQLGHLKRELAPEIVYYVQNGWRLSALVASVQGRGSGGRRKDGINIAVLVGGPSITDAEITAYKEMIAPAIMADAVVHLSDNDDSDDCYDEDDDEQDDSDADSMLE